MSKKSEKDESKKKDQPHGMSREEYTAWVRQGIGNVIASNEIKPREVISSGSICLDRILGIGGFPKGAIVELWGIAGSGKSTIAITTAIEAQKNKKTVIYIDAEHSFDNEYAKYLGLDFDRFIRHSTDNMGNFSAENIMNITKQALLSPDIELVIIDSLPALIPRKTLEEMEEDIDESGRSFPLLPGILSRWLPKFMQITAYENKLLLVINQVRANTNAGWSVFAPPFIRPCGKALEHATKILLQLMPSKAISEGQKNIGRWVRVKIDKSKVAKSQEGEFPLIQGEGIDIVREVEMLAKEFKIFGEQDGKYTYRDQVIGKTIAGLRGFARNNPTLFEELIMEIRNAE